MEQTPRKPDRPILWIVAGPNGSGKSSLYNRTDIEGWNGSVWINNPDLLTVRIEEQEKLSLADANLEAVKRIEEWLYSSIAVHQTIGVETVLSSAKYLKLVSAAHDRGFVVKMIYVALDSAEAQIARVRLRVSEGGHDVPVEKIIDRRRRSFAQLTGFFPMVDDCFVFNNSGSGARLVGVKVAGRLQLYDALPPDLRTTFGGAGIEIVEPDDDPLG